PVAGVVLEEPPLRYGAAWDAASYGDLRGALDHLDDARAFAKVVAKRPLPSPGPRGERTYGELRGFYAAERVLSYFRDIDPAFIDARSAGDEPATALITDASGKVRAPVLVLAGEPRLGRAADDPAEWRL